MKTLVVISALVACCAAHHAVGHDSGLWGPSYVSPSYYAAPSPFWAGRAYAIPATYSPGPALVYRRAYSPFIATAPAPVLAAPVVHAAPAPVLAAPVVPAAPAPALTAAVVPAAPVLADPAPALATPAVLAEAAPLVAAAVPSVTKTQYHAQNELGEASYGHSEPLQTHNAVQDAHGNKVGSFSYLNPHDGQIHRTDYVADAAGYRVAANDLPLDTPEVALAKAAHLTAHALARSKRSLLAVAETPASTSPLATHFIASPYLAAHPAPAYFTRAAYLAPLPHPAPLVLPVAAPALRAATLTTVVNNPGHAVSYRVD